METAKTDWSKYSNEAIDFILSQSEKTMKETFVSYRENTNKSYAALAIFSGLLSYCITHIIDKGQEKIFVYFLFLSIGMVFCIGIIFLNLKPNKMTFIGSRKSLLCQEYYEKDITQDQQIKEYKIQTIETYDEAIEENQQQIVCQVKAFKISVYLFLATLLITFFSFLIIG
jgi:sensor histidine kinase YesM